jgi:hypothetical protein
MNTRLAPIVLFTYNRPKHTRLVLEALKKNYLASESILIIYQDGIKEESSEHDLMNWRAVNNIIKDISGFKEIIIRSSNKNQGCDPSMINGITEVVNEYGKIIVLEDDLVVSPKFLSYMNAGLKLYQEEDKVGAINAYSYRFKEKLPNYFFMRGVNPYGWATWEKYWKLYNPDSVSLVQEIEKKKMINDFDFGNTFKILQHTTQTGAKGGRDAIWYASLFTNNILGLFPSHSFVHNIGFDESGTHTFNVSKEIREAQWPIQLLNETFENEDLKGIIINEDRYSKRIIQRKYNELSGKYTGKKKFISEYFKLKHFIKTNILKRS